MSQNFYFTPQYTEFENLHLFYQEILGHIDQGSFIEIGAFDGQTNSKTAHLADRGWKGIYVEPVHEYATKCSERHKHNQVEVLNFGISDKNGDSEIFKGGLPSTIKKDHADHIAASIGNSSDREFNFEKENIKTITWGSFYQDYVQNTPEVLVIDAEGFDLAIIEAIDFTVFRPTIIFCEVFPPETTFIDARTIVEGQKIVSHLKMQGYQIWLQEDHNILFSTKPLPSNEEEIQNLSFNSILNEINCKKLNIDYLNVIQQLLKTAILQKDLERIKLFGNYFANIMDPSCEQQLRLLTLLLYHISEFEQGANVLKHLSQFKNGDRFKIDNLNFFIQLNLESKIDYTSALNLVEKYPHEKMYPAILSLNIQAYTQ